MAVSCTAPAEVSRKAEAPAGSVMQTPPAEGSYQSTWVPNLNIRPISEAVRFCQLGPNVLL